MTARLAAPHLFNDRRWTFSASRNDDKRTPDTSRTEASSSPSGHGAGNTDPGQPEGVTRS